MSVPSTLPSSQDCIDSCNSLLRGELSAQETYRQAIEKFSGTPEAGVLQDLAASHSRHSQILRDHVLAMNGEPASGSGAWGAFAKAVEGTAKLFGNTAALEALIAGERHGVAEYEESLDDPGVMDEIKSVIRSELLPALRSNILTLERLQETA